MIAQNQMPGWQEWEHKIYAMIHIVPKVAVIRAARAMGKVIVAGLKDETLFAKIDSARVKDVAVGSIGQSFRKNKGDTQRIVRVGYGVGKRERGLVTRGGKRTVVNPEKLSDRFGTRTVYRRRVAGPRGRKAPAEQAILSHMYRGKLKRVDADKFREKYRPMARRMARYLARGIKTPAKKTGIFRIRGVGLSKRNIHWAVFGSHKQPGGVRTVLNWRGTGRSRKVGRFRAYLFGILDRTLRKYGRAAAEAAMGQMLLVWAAAYTRRMGSLTARKARIGLAP